MKPSEILHVPKSPVPIEDHEAPHLDNITNGGLLRQKTPSDIEASFLQRGLIYRATGGLMPTETGYRSLDNWQKENQQ